MSSVAARVLESIRINLDPVAFVRERMGVEPEGWQADILRDSERRICITCSRQIGKSFTVSLKASQHCATTPNGLALIFSDTQQQSINLMRKAKQHIQHAGLPIKKELRTEIEFLNGARMVALPGDPKTSRSWSDVTMLIVDEAAFAEDELYYAVEPMVLQTNGQIILLSSAYETTGFFYKIATGDDPYWSRYRVTVWESERVPREWIERKQLLTPDYQFRREYLAEFVDPEGATFTAEQIRDMFDNDVKPLGEEDEHTIMNPEVEAL